MGVTLTQRSRSSPVRLGPSTLGWMIESRWDSGRHAGRGFRPLPAPAGCGEVNNKIELAIKVSAGHNSENNRLNLCE